jgi:tape measure domain-containing protein
MDGGDWIVSSIDERIVQMQFDNKQFENGIKTSTQSLKDLEKSLELKDAGKSFLALEKASKALNFDHLMNSVDTIAKRFTSLGIMGKAVLEDIARSAYNTGKQLLKSLSVDQLTEGFSKYEKKIANVQAIMNATGKSVDEVNGYLDELLWFSDETSFGFTDMTQALAGMTSAGGDIATVIPLITGMATATAYAGKSAADYGLAMRNITQSYQKGYLTGMDWKSLEGVSVASKALKQTFIDTGVAMGKIKKGEVTLENFVDTLTDDKWADKSVMETTLTYWSAVSSEAYDLVKSGKFKTTKEAIESLAAKYSELQMNAVKSAQSAKTFTEAIKATRDAVSTGWMKSYEIIVGNLVDATQLWSKVTGTLWETFASGAEARNEMIQGWRDLGGRNSLITGLVNLYNALTSIGKIIKHAWEVIFPPATADSLFNVTKGFEGFTKGILDWLFAMNGSTTRLEQIGKIFEGFFGILSIGWKIVKSVFGAIGKAIGFLLPGSAVDSILTFFANVGDAIGNFAKNLEVNETFIAVFKAIGDALGYAVGFIGAVIDVIPGWIASLNVFFKFLFKDIGESKIWGGILTVIQETFNFLIGFIPAVLSAIPGWISSLGVFFKFLWGDIFGDKYVTGTKGGGGTPPVVDFFAQIVTFLKGIGTSLGGEWVKRFDQISKIFEGFFGILKIGWEVVKNVFKSIGVALSALGGSIESGSIFDSILGFFAGIGTSISDFAKNLKTNETFIAFFKAIGDVVGPIAAALPGIAKSIWEFFKTTIASIRGSEVFKKAKKIFLDFISAIPTIIAAIWQFAKGIYVWLTTSEQVKGWVKAITDFLAPVINLLKGWAKTVGTALRGLFGAKGLDTTKSFWQLLKEQFATKEGASEFIDNVVALVKSVWASIKAKVVAIFTGKGGPDTWLRLASGGATDFSFTDKKKPGFFAGLFGFLGELVKWLGANWGWIIAGLGAVALIKLAFAVTRVLDIFGGIAGTIVNFKAAAPIIVKKNIGDTFLKVAGAIGIIVAAIYSITLMAKDSNFDKALMVVGGIVAVLAGLVVLDAAINKAAGAASLVKKPSMGGIGTSMLAMAGAVMLIIMAVQKMKTILDSVKGKFLEEMGPALVAVGAILLALIVLSKIPGGGGINGNWKSIIATAAAVWIIVRALKPIIGVEWEDIKKMGAVLGGITVAIGALILISKIGGGGKGKIAGIIGLALGIALLIEVLRPLVQYKDEDLKKMGWILAGVVLALSIFIKSAKGMTWKSAGASVLLMIAFAGMIYLLSKALVRIKEVDEKKISAFTTGLTAFMIGFGIFLKASKKAGLKGVGVALLAMVGLIAIISLVAIAFSALSKDQGIKDFLNGGATFLGELVGNFTGAMKAAEFKGFSAGLAGFKDLKIDQAAIRNATDAGKILSDFSETLPKKGVVQQILDWLGASNLAVFSRDIGLFGEGFASFAASMGKVKLLDIPLLALKTGGAILIAEAMGAFDAGLEGVGTFTRIASLLAGKSMSNLALFSEDLASFGTAFNAYAVSMDTLAVNKALTAEELKTKTDFALDIAGSIALFSTGLDEVGLVTSITSLFSWIAGMSSTSGLGLLSKDMPAFGKAFETYNDTMSKMPEVDETLLTGKTKAAIAIAQQIVDFNAGVEDPGDLSKISTWFTTQSATKLGMFSKDMAGFGTGFNTFVTAMTPILENITPLLGEKTTAAIAIAQQLVNFEGGIPTYEPLTKVTTWFTDVPATELALLSAGIAAFGPAMNAYVTAIDPIKEKLNGDLEAKTKTAIAIAKAISLFETEDLPPVDLNTIIPEWILGTSPIVENAKDMDAFVTGFNEFAIGMEGIDAITNLKGWEGKSASAIAIAKSISDLATNLPPISGDELLNNWLLNPDYTKRFNRVTENSAKMRDFAIGFNEFATEMMKLTVPEGFATQVDVAVGSANKVGDAIASLSVGITPEKVQVLKAALSELSIAFATSFYTGVPLGIQNGTDLVLEQVRLVLAASVLTADSFAGSEGSEGGETFFKAGVNAVQGFANGVALSTWIAENAAWNMADAAITAAMDALGEGSPSAKFEDIADNAVLGFVIGMDKNTSKAEKAARVMGEGITSGLQRGLGNAKDVSSGWLRLATAGDTDFSFQPYVDETVKTITTAIPGSKSFIDGLKDAYGTVIGKAPVDSYMDSTKLKPSLSQTIKGAWQNPLDWFANLFGGSKTPTVSMGGLHIAERDEAARLKALNPPKGVSTKRTIERINWSETVGKSLSQMRDMSILANKLDHLGEAVTNMKIVMNSGVVVGQIRSEMDRQLGVLAQNAGRRN